MKGAPQNHLALWRGKKCYRSDEAVPAEGVAFSPHGFQIVHRPYFAASFDGLALTAESVANSHHTSRSARASYAPSRVVVRRRVAAQVTVTASRDKRDRPNREL